MKNFEGSYISRLLDTTILGNEFQIHKIIKIITQLSIYKNRNSYIYKKLCKHTVRLTCFTLFLGANYHSFPRSQ